MMNDNLQLLGDDNRSPTKEHESQHLSECCIMFQRCYRGLFNALAPLFAPESDIGREIDSKIIPLNEALIRFLLNLFVFLLLFRLRAHLQNSSRLFFRLRRAMTD